MSNIAVITRRTMLTCFAVAALAAVLLTGPAQAQYPDRPVKIIVPFAPGGGADVSARVVQPLLQQALGPSVVIENRAGAAGNIGSGAAAKADPGGYTLLLTSSVFTSNPATAQQNFYDAGKEFEPIVSFGGSPN